MEYFVHDNGSRPFKVQVDGSTVKVFKHTKKFTDYAIDTYHEQPAYVYKTTRVFVGNCPKYKNDFGKGNAILLEIDTFDSSDGSDSSNRSDKNIQYVLIYRDIVSFTPYNKITKFVSFIGNNDVTDPYMIDESGIFYVFDDGVCYTLNPVKMPRKLQKIKNKNPFDLIRSSNITNMGHNVRNCKCNGGNPFKPVYPVKFNIRGKMVNIVQFWVNRKDTILFHTKTDHYKGKSLYIVTKWNRPKQEITHEEYMDIMKQYSAVMGFGPELKINVINTYMWSSTF